MGKILSLNLFPFSFILFSLSLTHHHHLYILGENQALNQNTLNLTEAALKSKHLFTLLMIGTCLVTTSCSTPVVRESTPEEQVRQARKDIDKDHFEKASKNLQELRLATAGTRLGGEVQFLLGETEYKRGKYPEAESQYAAYLNAYPGGPFSEQALYMEAMAKVKQIQKHKVGFLTFRTYIPYDRDISLVTEARSLFEAYLEMYPEGRWVEEASQKVEELRFKEGQHDLEIASFYLRKNSPASALARARKVLEGNYPESITAEARDLMRRAQDSLDRTGKGKDL